jgi:uncharacterized membrane protein
VLERLFELLFKYRPVVFERGEFAFAPPWPAVVVLVLAIAVAVPAVLLYRRTGGRLDRRDRIVLSMLRVAAVGILGFCLLRPMLIVATVVPQENFLGILVDDSRSMQITDGGDASRAERVLEAFGSPTSPLVSALAERFKLRFFRFSETARRLNDSTELDFSGRRTDLGRALDMARRELGGVPLAGLIVVTDGAENGASGETAQSILQLQSDGVPVYTVGVGDRRYARDIALRRASAPGRVLAGSAIAVDVELTQSGYGGTDVELVVEDAGRILTTTPVDLPRDGDVTTARVHFTVDEPGPRSLRFRIDPRDGEAVTANNELAALIVVEDRRPRILYFEGEPRFEVKFLRRAVQDDEHVRVVVLQRTADEKFYAIDVDDEDDLVEGFPTTREELFRYDGLVLGTVEASFFTHDQLRMLADFVGRRGGGLLALGGRRSFAEGGYAGTPLADALPVVLERRPIEGDSFFAPVRIRPTAFGATHPVTQLGTADDALEDRWRSLPALSAVNRIRELKPGASALLEATGDGFDDPVPALAYHRYGRGRAAVLAVQDTWLWQMHADIPLEDQTHETLWRQLLRWLVEDVPNHVTATADVDLVESGTPVTITAEVSDSGYIRVNGADVDARIVAPDGSESSVPLEWSVQRDGEYRATIVPNQDGRYEVHVDAAQSGAPLGADVMYVESGDLGSEFRNAELQQDALERIAEETGGRYYDLGSVETLPEDVSFTESGTTVREERDLWDMPILLIALLAFLAAEWTYRRQRGLA